MCVCWPPKIPAHVNTMIQKLCTILGLLKALLLMSDSYILQLVKTCFSTLLVDNIQLWLTISNFCNWRYELDQCGTFNFVFSLHEFHVFDAPFPNCYNFIFLHWHYRSSIYTHNLEVMCLVKLFNLSGSCPSQKQLPEHFIYPMKSRSKF